MSVGLLSHESAERDDRRNAGEEEEDDGSEALHVETVFQHAPVHPRMIAVLYVVDHASEKSAKKKNSLVENIRQQQRVRERSN